MPNRIDKENNCNPSEEQKNNTLLWIADAVDRHGAKAIEVSDAVWETPELAGHEEKSSKTLMNALSEAGFKIVNPVGGISTAFTATYGNGKPVIGLLAEYDCVSGVSQKAGILKQEAIIEGGNGHGCGHNLLGAGCVGAALALKDYIDENRNSGTVIVFGCPAEESGGGKTFMAREGVFKDVDVALSWHPGDWTGVVNASLQADVWMKYSFIGKASHAAVAPEMGRSALDAVELMDVGANYLREHVPPDVRFHYAVMDTGGTSPNVVQPSAQVVYLIRASTLENVNSVRERIDDIARGAALMTGTMVNIEFMTGCSAFQGNTVVGNEIFKAMSDIGAPKYGDIERKIAEDYSGTLDNPGTSAAIMPLIKTMIKKDPTLSYLPKAALNDVIIPYVPSSICSPGTSDVGDVSQNCPTVMFMVTTYAQGTPGHSWQMVAQGTSALAHAGMLYSSKVMALTAVRFIENPELIESAWTEFNDEHACSAYECPIPSEIRFVPSCN